MSEWLQDEKKRKKWTRFAQELHPSISPQSLQLIDEFRYVARSIHQRIEQSVEKSGLSSAQYRILMHLFFQEEMSERLQLNPSEISKRQGVSPNTISALIRHLEEDELVERNLDPTDRRRFNISLTEDGRDLVRAYAREHLETIGQCFEALTTPEREELIQLLFKMRQRISSVPESESD